MAILPERSSQGGHRNVYFYTESATSFKVVFSILKCICEYLWVTCLDTRKDTVWQVVDEKYPEQCTSWTPRRLKCVLLRPSQSWHSNELRGSLARHLQRASDARAAALFPAENLLPDQRNVAQPGSAGSDSPCLLARPACESVLGLIPRPWRGHGAGRAPGAGGGLAATPPPPRASCKWRTALNVSHQLANKRDIVFVQFKLCCQILIEREFL